MGLGPLVLAIDASTGLYVGLHWHLVSSSGALGLPLGIITAAAAALTVVSVVVLLLAWRPRVRFGMVLLDAAALAWFVWAVDPRLSSQQENFLWAAVLAALATSFYGTVAALWYLPIGESALVGSER